MKILARNIIHSDLLRTPERTIMNQITDNIRCIQLADPNKVTEGGNLPIQWPIKLYACLIPTTYLPLTSFGQVILYVPFH